MGIIVPVRSEQNGKINEIICSEGGCIILLDGGDKNMQSHTNIKVHVGMHVSVVNIGQIL